NLFAGLPTAAPQVEQFDELWRTAGLRIERIVSWGHATAAGDWFDQESDEWVVLLTGTARLCIEGRAELLEMQPGDWVFLPTRVRHRVEWTDPTDPTVWLAVHALREPDQH